MGVLAPVQWLGAQSIGFLRGMAEVFALLYGALLRLRSRPLVHHGSFSHLGSPC